MKSLLVAFVFLLLTGSGFSQASLQAFNQERTRITGNGMLVLGSWGAVNIISGAIGMAASDGEAKYFHQMNLLWGTVNFAIASATYLGLRKKQSDLSFSKSVKAQVAIEKTFLINGGLDLVYITAGLYCLEKRNNTSNPDKYAGYGNSLLMQGGGLLLFDAIMYIININHGKQLYKLLEKIQFTGNAVGVVWKL
jgi:hypothetical protein